MKIIRSIGFITTSVAMLLLSIPVSGIAFMGGAVQGRDIFLTLDNASVTTLAGSSGAFGSTDGIGSAVQFKSPESITTDGTNLYVADTGNHTIRKIVISTGAVTTLAGLAGTSGTSDGTGSMARFNNPASITTDGINLYVADSSNRTIRMIVITTGAVTTLAGRAGVIGSTDGTGSAARFNNPTGITTDGINLYVADTWSQTIRNIVIATGEVTTLAGLAGSPGSDNGTGTGARFRFPSGITTDGMNLYVVDGYYTIRKIEIVTGVVTTLAGSPFISGSIDGMGSAARFYDPHDLTTDGMNLYVADGGNDSIRKIVIATGAVTTLAGLSGLSGSVDGMGFAARFYRPWGITTDGINLYVADHANVTIRKICGVPSFTLIGGAVQGIDLSMTLDSDLVETLAGSAGRTGYANGTGSTARFYWPAAITTDGTNLYVADSYNDTIRKVVIATRAVTTFAGSPGMTGYANGTGSAARFNNPTGITTDGTNLYVADTANHIIRKIVIATGIVSTLAGSVGSYGSADGTGAAAKFYNPRGITTDGTNLYIADNDNHTIRNIVISTGAVTTLAGSVGSYGSPTDGTGSVARFYDPWGITTDGANLYVADTGNSTIRKIVIATRAVTTLAGSAGIFGSADGTGSLAEFRHPRGITTDGINLYVSDSYNDTIRKIVIATGAVTTLAGLVGTSGSSDGTGSEARFYDPRGLTTDGINLYVTDNNHTIRKIGAPSADIKPPIVTGVITSPLTNSMIVPVTITAIDHAGGSGLAAYLVNTSSTRPTATDLGWSTSNPFMYSVTIDGTYTLYGWAKDGAGNVSAQYSPITITVDRTPPIITGSSPTPNANGIVVGNVITVTFSEAMNASTIDSSTFRVETGTKAVAGTVTYNAISKMATFKPSSPLSYNTSYLATLTTDVKDEAGNHPEATCTWNFSTQQMVGDLNDDSLVNIADVILCLQIMAGINTSGQNVNRFADTNADNKIALPEAIYIMQKAAGMR